MGWLTHYIKHTNAGPSKPWKLLLLAGQESHKTPEFVLTSLTNHMDLIQFPSRMALDITPNQPLIHPQLKEIVSWPRPWEPFRRSTRLKVGQSMARWEAKRAPVVLLKARGH